MEKIAIQQLEAYYHKTLPKYPFEFTFMDEDYQALYNSEMQVASLSNYMGALAIIISCLGLFGLAAFTAERRAKEIGIRKVLGSSIWGIVSLLTRDFTRMVIIAIFIAIPISYLWAKYWLDSYADRIELHWYFFGGAAAITLLVAWLTIGFQTLKTAGLNPVDSLKNE